VAMVSTSVVGVFFVFGVCVLMFFFFVGVFFACCLRYYGGSILCLFCHSCSSLRRVGPL